MHQKPDWSDLDKLSATVAQFDIIEPVIGTIRGIWWIVDAMWRTERKPRQSATAYLLSLLDVARLALIRIERIPGGKTGQDAADYLATYKCPIALRRVTPTEYQFIVPPKRGDMAKEFLLRDGFPVINVTPAQRRQMHAGAPRPWENSSPRVGGRSGGGS